MNYAKEANRILAKYRQDEQEALDRRKKEVYQKIPDYERLEEVLQQQGFAYVSLCIHEKNSKVLQEKKDELQAIQQQLLNLLIEYGYPKDYLDKKYHCSLCQDEGSVEGHICDCKKKIMVELSYEKSEIQEKLLTENFENFDFNLFRETKEKGEEYSPRELMHNIYEFSKRYIETFPQGESLLFSGPVGVGKTFVCSCITKALLDQGYSVIYQSAPQLMKFLWDYYYSSFEERAMMRKKYEILMNADLLVLDDLGTESMNDTSLSHFFDLLNNRLQFRKSMVISTNLELEDIRDHYDERISSRILGEFTIVSLYGEDLRLKKLGL